MVSVLGLLRDAGTDVWIAGGWGVDALVGEQTREHCDLDLLHRGEQEPAVLAALFAAGFTESLDLRPVRFVLDAPDGRQLDLHPLVFAPDGSALQASHDPEHPFAYPAACFTAGTVGGAAVPCISAAQQDHFHQGYEPTARDRLDMAHLRRVFGIRTHF
ncbi:hypothetical protein GCM10018793_31060 [Streptomyces sulfonofaciens]|uniref:Amino acid transporter n=1 Tax=Streptomyces sulfonofaciens TaxID=68272 RepID=A0A919L0N5_9ACTN|nr:hypothetical protein GCM10018793_31060 [Streptomyces sulfonofaciens]